MRKAIQNYILFVLLFLLGLFQAVSGFIMWFVLPHGGGGGGHSSGGGGGTESFWSLPRDIWLSLHDWTAVALLLVIILHLILHWRWIVYMTKSYFKRTRQSGGST